MFCARSISCIMWIEHNRSIFTYRVVLPCHSTVVILIHAPLSTKSMLHSALQHSLVQGLSVFHSCMRSQLLPDQLPGEHTSHLAPVSAFLFQHINLGKCTLFELNTGGFFQSAATSQTGTKFHLNGRQPMLKTLHD